jgi:hypothetical protein
MFLAPTSGRLTGRGPDQAGVAGSIAPAMAEPPKRTPPPDRVLSRVLGVAGVIGLFVVLIVIVALIGGAGDKPADNQRAATAPTATATSTPRPTPTPSPTPKPLTPNQKLDRQDDIDVVRSRGYAVVKKTDWHPQDTLQVLVGRSSSGSEFAFFFVNGDYLGNDSTSPSARVRVKKTDDLEVTLSYGVFVPGDTTKPSGTPITVTFRYAGGRVTPLSALPSPQQRTPGQH